MYRLQTGIWSKLTCGAMQAVATIAITVCGLQDAQAARIDAHEAAILTQGTTVDPLWATPKPIVEASATATTAAKNVRMDTNYNRTWVAAYHTGNPAPDGSQPPPGQNSKLMVTRSLNDGGTWADPVQLLAPPESETDYNFRPDVVHGTNDTEEYLMVFETYTSPTGTQLYKTKSVDSGLSWDSPLLPLGNFPNDNVNPRKVSLASDHFGNYMAAWIADADGGGLPGLTIAYSNNFGSDWTIKQRIAGTGDGRPQVRCHRDTVDDPGRWVVVFEKASIDADLNPMYAASEDNGDTWVVKEINTNAASENVNDLLPRIDYSPSNFSWVAVWASESGVPGVYNIQYARADEDVFNPTDGGFTWSDPAVLQANVTFGGPQQIDQWISTDDADHWIAIWSAVTSTGGPAVRDLFASISNDDGDTFDASTLIDDFDSSSPRWLNPVLMSNNSPVTPPDKGGRWLAMWQNLAGQPQTAASPQTEVPWYTTTFIPLSPDQPRLDVAIAATDINGGKPIYATSQAPGAPPSAFTVTYTVTNFGPDPAFDVQVTINPQQPITCVSYTDDGGAVSPLVSTTQFPSATFTGSYAQLNVGESASFTVQFQAPTAPGRYRIIADAIPHDDQGAEATDIDQSNNVNVITYVDIGEAVTIADLRVTKTCYPIDVVLTGADLGYTITVWNDSGETAENVVVSDPLPAGLIFRYAAVSHGSWSLETTNSITTAKAIFPSIGVGARETFVIGTYPTTGAPSLITNVACASFDGVDLDESNNCAEAAVAVSTTVGSGADLTLQKSCNVTSVTQGTSCTYTLRVTNVGPSAASSVVVTDVLPSTLNFNGQFHTQGTVTRSGQTITANLGSLAVGKVAKVNISVIPIGTGVITNTANVTSQTNDPIPANNSGSNNLTVVAADPNTVANLSVTKTANPSPANVGSPLTYTVQVSNAGPSAASNVKLQDLLPPEVTFVSSTPTESTYANGLVSYTLASLNSGASSTFQILTNPITGGTAINTASVSSDNPDLTPSNNSVSISTVINGGTGNKTNADLALSSSVSPASTSVGNAITWTLTAHNNGPQSAAAIVVNTTLPGIVTFVSATGPSGSASPIGNVLNVPIAVLASGASADVTITLVPLSGGNLTLTGSISGNVNDSVASNNTASSVVPVSGASLFDLQGTWIKLKKKSKQSTVPNWSIKGTLSVKNLRTTLLVAAPVQFYLSTDSSYSPSTDTLVGTGILKKIKPGKSKKKSVSAKFTFDPAHQYLLAVINPSGSDPENVVPILIP